MCTSRREPAATQTRSNLDVPTLGAWVEQHDEACRGGRTHRLLVNRRDHIALTLTLEESELCRRLAVGLRGELSSQDRKLVSDLREQGFLTGRVQLSPPQPRRVLGGLRTFLATLEVRCERGNELVRALHDRGAHRLFTRHAVTAQILLALAGMAAVVHTYATHSLHLRLNPAQVPAALALSLLAIGVHELSHALVVVHNGRRIDAVAFRLHLGTPAFYVESVEALLLSRRQRILQAFAGSWAEWMITSTVALWVWVAPCPIAMTLLARFVILNSLTIATNLLPFVGLDGHLLLADLIGEPDLGITTRGALGRVLAGLAADRAPTGRDYALAAYGALNSAVATALAATAGLFWYSMFGNTVARLAQAGPAGWCALALIGTVLARPIITAAVPRVADGIRGWLELTSRLRFRTQWHWRIEATRAFAAAIPAVQSLDDSALGLLAGELVLLHPSRSRRPATPAEPGSGFIYLRRGSVVTTGGHHCSKGAVLAADTITGWSRSSAAVVLAAAA